MIAWLQWSALQQPELCLRQRKRKLDFQTRDPPAPGREQVNSWVHQDVGYRWYHINIVKPEVLLTRWPLIKQVSRPPMSSSDWDLTFTWHAPDVHLTTWPSSDLPLPDPYLTMIKRFQTSPEVHLKFIWRSPGIPWRSPDIHLTTSFQLKKSCVVVGGWWWINPLQTLSQGLVLTFPFTGLVLTLRFTFDPELDKR